MIYVSSLAWWHFLPLHNVFFVVLNSVKLSPDLINPNNPMGLEGYKLQFLSLNIQSEDSLSWITEDNRSSVPAGLAVID